LRCVLTEGDDIWNVQGENFQQSRDTLFEEQMNPYKDYVEEDEGDILRF